MLKERAAPYLDRRRSESGGTRIVAGLKRGQRSGATQAGAQLDSLRALGVFERHPHLADA